jgi:hypothetical protein
MAGINTLSADENRVYRCANAEQVHSALDSVRPGDTIMLQGGNVYEIDESFRLKADGTADQPIHFTSEDSGGHDRYAVISTVGGKKEENLAAVRLTGSFWRISRLEISGVKVPRGDGYWDIHGFRIGLYLSGPGSHHNILEDILVHHTHNTAVAIRDQSHHNIFRRMNIHHIGEWLDESYNAHEAEGFYIGSSKGLNEAGKRARVNDIIIEGNTLGPGILGQFIDIKYGASQIFARNNVLHCNEKSYNQEVVKLAGFANVVEDNIFVGSNQNMTRYVHVFNKKTNNPVRVDYQGQFNIPAPTGRDNKVANNSFYTNDEEIVAVKNDLSDLDRTSLLLEDNRSMPLEKFE